MPTLAIVDGVSILMFWNDHTPPHFHARFAGDECRIDIATFHVLEGRLPSGKMSKVMSWAREHQTELTTAWKACRRRQKPERIGS